MAQQDLKVAVSYFKKQDGVSALYLFGPDYDFPTEGLGLGVLADNMDSGSSELDSLEHDCILRSTGPLNIVMLNTAPLYLKHYVASRGKVLFVRNKGSHLRFTRRTIDEYTSVAFHGDDFGPSSWGMEFPGGYPEEEYLS